jgi:hypothetical protein
LAFYLVELVKAEIGVPEAELQEVQKKVNFDFPQEYADFLREFNGAEGEVGENSWLVIFRLEQLIPFNKALDLLNEDSPPYFVFGKDAAETDYGFHKIDKTFHSFGAYTDYRDEEVVFCGNSFSEFIEFLYNHE